ncbi:MAG: hypothetical protein ACK5P5_05680 [Pseudobdellovibrionaceae bacterium]
MKSRWNIRKPSAKFLKANLLFATCIGLSSLPAFAQNAGSNSTCQASQNLNQETALTTNLARQIEAPYRVHSVQNQPRTTTTTQITYSFTQEIVLDPQQAIYFAIPAHLQNRTISFVILGHRQNPSTHIGWNHQSNRDDVPGLISFQAHPKGAQENHWRFWAGSSSGNFGAKFAEPRPTPEMENLYDWMTLGHRSILSNDLSQTPLSTDTLRLVSVGTDKVHIKELTIKFLPDQPTSFIEKIFTPGTQFHPTVGQKGSFGGGQRFQGLFPQALALNSSNPGHSFSQGDRFELVGGSLLSAELPVGKRLVSVELAAGDSHPNQITNSDGGYGTQGWAKFSIGKGPANAQEHQIKWFTNRENSPPEGLLFGSPEACDAMIRQGERLYIRAQDDVFYIMGLRIGLN